MRIIRASFVNKNIIRDEELVYEHKVKLSVAMGLRIELSGPLNCLGTLRNKLAHNLNEALTKEKADTFFKSFSKKDQNLIKELYAILPDGTFLNKPENHYDLTPKLRFGVYIIVLREILRLGLLQQSKTTQS